MKITDRGIVRLRIQMGQTSYTVFQIENQPSTNGRVTMINCFASFVSVVCQRRKLETRVKRGIFVFLRLCFILEKVENSKWSNDQTR